MIFDWRAVLRILGYTCLFVLVCTVLILIYHWAAGLFAKPQPAVATGPGQYHFTVNGPDTQPPASQVIYVPVVTEQKTTTTVAVAEKKKNDPTDLEYRMKTNYFVDINGKKYEVAPTVKEDTKLQNNKIVVEQESQLGIKVDVPQPVGSFGAGVNNHGEMAVMADGRIWKNLNWWVYASRSEQAVGLKVTIYK
jgi:hypothetical protein